MDLGRVGVWWSSTRHAAGDGFEETLAEVEELGYRAFWSSGLFGPGVAPHFDRMLGATQNMVVASGIITVWHTTPAAVAAGVAELDSRYPNRFLLGLGASHAPLTEDYHRPYSRMVAYLDEMAALDDPVGKDRMVLAALGPRMLALAGERTAGVHPYFVPVAHTARAREILGAGPLIAPEVTVVLEIDPVKAREIARSFTATYLALPNYANNLRSLGYTENDVAGAGSDRLVDDVIVWGDVDAVAGRVRQHHEAGADHVCLQVVTGDASFPIDAFRALAPAVLAG